MSVDDRSRWRAWMRARAALHARFSTNPEAPASSRRAEFQAYVTDSRARSGTISIPKEVGVVVATRP